MRQILSNARMQDYLIRLFLLISIGSNLLHYFSGETLAGWDTIGHRHLYESFLSFASEGRALGYDSDWFQGYPAFYFYPPLLYFCMAQLQYLLSIPGVVDLDWSFNIGILCVILFLIDSIYVFIRYYLIIEFNVWVARGVALACAWMYYLYPGEGLQAAGVVGIIEGTINSGLGHALALRTFLALDRFRITLRIMNLAWFILYYTLLFYAHYLSLVFMSIPLLVYSAFYWKELDIKKLLFAVLIVLILAAPLTYLYFVYGAYRSGLALYQNYPALLSWLGTDFFQEIAGGNNYFVSLVKLVFLKFKWIQLLAVGLFISFVVRVLLGSNHGDDSSGETSGSTRMIKRRQYAFLIVTTIVMGWTSQDSSLLNIFPFVGIHWYRSFDLFLSFALLLVGLQAAYLFMNIMRQRPYFIAGICILLLIGLRVFIWDPVAHQKHRFHYTGQYASDDFEHLSKELAKLPPHSLILPELLKEKSGLGSPHALDYWIQKYGHRNALGLTIESAPSARISYAYTSQAMPWMFRWGISPDWERYFFNNLPGPDPLRLIEYLERSGVQYVLGRSARLDAFLKKYPDRFEVRFMSGSVFLYMLKRSQSGMARFVSQPIGIVDYRVLGGHSYDARKDHDNFLLTANYLRNRMQRVQTPIINISPRVASAQPVPWHSIKALIIMNPENTRVQIGLDLVPNNSLVPVFLFNLMDESRRLNALDLRPGSQLPEILITDSNAVQANLNAHLYVRLQGSLIELRIPPINRARGCQPVQLHLTYFPDWEARTLHTVYQTDNNQMLVCPGEPRLELIYQNRAGHLIYFILYLLLAGVIILCGVGAVYTWSGMIESRKLNKY